MMIKVTPALSAVEWSRFEYGGEARLPIAGGVGRGKLPGDLRIWTYGSLEMARESLPALIALANHSLHPDDARKITAEKIRVLRAELGTASPVVREFVDALEAYLPPEIIPETFEYDSPATS